MSHVSEMLGSADRFANLTRQIRPNAAPEDERQLAEKLCEQHVRRIHGESLLLYGGCNEVSKACERMLASGLGQLPAMGRPGAKDQPGTAEISALEQLVEQQLIDIFGGAFAEARLPSCTLANAVLYRMFTGNDRRIAALSGQAGAHISSQGNGTPLLFETKVIELPFDAVSLDIDVPKAVALITEKRPPLVIVGASVALRPFSVRDIANCCHEYGGLLVVDVAHTAGLIAGRAMPNPLDDGADFMTGSTYKSLGGPPGAFLIGSSKVHEAQLRTLVCPTLTSNYDASRLAALAVALAEVKAFMPDYAKAMVSNAVVLAKACGQEGLNVVTAPGNEFPTHQVLLSTGDRARTAAFVDEAERAGIIVGANVVPGSPGQFCLRVGTQVITRRGMRGSEMVVIAKMLREVVTYGASLQLSRRVRDLTQGFQTIHFGYP